MKRYFITGLVIVLPLVLTLLIFAFLLNLLTKPFEGITLSLLDHFNLLGQPLFGFDSRQIIIFLNRLLTLMALVGFTFIIGFVARWFFVYEIIKLSDWVFHRIPLVNKIYRATQETVTTVFAHESRTFKQVVLVPYPKAPGLSIGLVTSTSIPNRSEEEYKKLVSVFIPGTPNPTVGFLLFYSPEQMIPLAMSVEEALKFVISMGVILPQGERL